MFDWPKTADGVTPRLVVLLGPVNSGKTTFALAVLRLQDFAGRSVILYAYPAAMTPGCTTQACSFRDAYEDFVKAGYDLSAEAILLCESDGTPEEVEEEIARMSDVLRTSGATAP